MDDALFQKIVADAPVTPSTAISDETFKAIVDGADKAQSPPQGSTEPTPPNPDDNSGSNANASYPKDTRPRAAAEAQRLAGVDQPVTDPTQPVLEGAAAGVADAGFQTKDFLTGETAEGDKSAVRKAVEKPQDGLGFNLTKGVAQFGVGLLGAGKIIKAAEGVEAIGGAIQGLRVARGGAAALESAKAAIVGAIAFDPHQERLSNLIQSSPALANPVNNFLASKPDDNAAVGRVKNALESLGMDAALVGVIGATVKGYRAVGTGTAAEAV